MRSAPALRTEGLVKRYGEGPTAVTAVAGVDLAFPAGGFTAVMGPSGSGKSTLLHLLAGLERPTSGRVFIEGRDLTGLDDRGLTRLRRDRIGFVFQSFNLLPALTAEQNILLPLRLAGRTPAPGALKTLVTTLGLGERLRHRPSALSGGQRQRVAIARALITEPAVVLADEPTGALDVAAGRELLDHLRTACDELGRTIVMVTHDPLAAARADRVLLLADGALHGVLPRPAPHEILSAMEGAR
ncbi:ABC transporter ATP-binding protein [Nocardiopsis sp. N85]|uniref:ABC transporter ATP-binding protein n=1 Tax=Nocardiopsis sp. N85 TaxID=3029400 RepID=UPI00237F5E14|nr:ABC transporter ATP-binding protein [Nocardiopsis sp. N85]MDE3720694.1 ABC transporter ATP-binding protein [Nocardiopsis sp. N85]